MHDYRNTLRNKLTSALERNKRYSLRAFARDLDIDVGQLSRVLNGKENLSVESAQLVAGKLFATKKQQQAFVYMVELATAKKTETKTRILEALKGLDTRNSTVVLLLDQFKLISEWYHIAILDLSSIVGQAITPRAVSRTLGISQTEAKLALERLMRLGLLTESEGRLQKTSRSLQVPESRERDENVRRFHMQMIQKAYESVEGQDTARRYLIGKTLAIAEKDLTKVKALADQFFKKVAVLVQESDTPDRLYQLNVQLFDLMKIEANEKSKGVTI